jgi:hypothetical protein
LGERLDGIQEVMGSNPFASTRKLKEGRHWAFPPFVVIRAAAA